MKKLHLIILFILICIGLVGLIRIYRFKDEKIKTSKIMLVNGQKSIAGTWIKVGSPLEVETLTKSDFEKLTNRDYKVYWIDDNSQRELLYKGKSVFFVKFSPSKDKLSFFYYPEGHSLGNIVLLIYDYKDKSLREVYRNSNRTSNYSWKDESTLVVNYSCGTACMLEYTVDAQSGKIIKKQQLY